MGKKRRTNWKVSISVSELEKLAPRLLAAFSIDVPGAHLDLCSSSGLWRRGNGTLTARLVYRSAAEPNRFSKVYTLRNISIDRTRSPEGVNG